MHDDRLEMPPKIRVCRTCGTWWDSDTDNEGPCPDSECDQRQDASYVYKRLARLTEEEIRNIKRDRIQAEDPPTR